MNTNTSTSSSRSIRSRSGSSSSSSSIAINNSSSNSCSCNCTSRRRDDDDDDIYTTSTKAISTTTTTTIVTKLKFIIIIIVLVRLSSVLYTDKNFKKNENYMTTRAITLHQQQHQQHQQHHQQEQQEQQQQQSSDEVLLVGGVRGSNGSNGSDGSDGDDIFQIQTSSLSNSSTFGNLNTSMTTFSSSSSLSSVSSSSSSHSQIQQQQQRQPPELGALAQSILEHQQEQLQEQQQQKQLQEQLQEQQEQQPPPKMEKKKKKKKKKKHEPHHFLYHNFQCPSLPQTLSFLNTNTNTTINKPMDYYNDSTIRYERHIHMIVKLGGQLGNQLSFVARAYAMKRSIEQKYYQDMVVTGLSYYTIKIILVGEPIRADNQSSRVQEELKTCFPSYFHNFIFKSGKFLNQCEIKPKQQQQQQEEQNTDHDNHHPADEDIYTTINPTNLTNFTTTTKHTLNDTHGYKETRRTTLTTTTIPAASCSSFVSSSSQQQQQKNSQKNQKKQHPSYFHQHQLHQNRLLKQFKLLYPELYTVHKNNINSNSNRNNSKPPTNNMLFPLIPTLDVDLSLYGMGHSNDVNTYWYHSYCHLLYTLEKQESSYLYSSPITTIMEGEEARTTTTSKVVILTSPDDLVEYTYRNSSTLQNTDRNNNDTLFQQEQEQQVVIEERNVLLSFPYLYSPFMRYIEAVDDYYDEIQQLFQFNETSCGCVHSNNNNINNNESTSTNENHHQDSPSPFDHNDNDEKYGMNNVTQRRFLHNMEDNQNVTDITTTTTMFTTNHNTTADSSSFLDDNHHHHTISNNFIDQDDHETVLHIRKFGDKLRKQGFHEMDAEQMAKELLFGKEHYHHHYTDHTASNSSTVRFLPLTNIAIVAKDEVDTYENAIVQYMNTTMQQSSLSLSTYSSQPLPIRVRQVHGSSAMEDFCYLRRTKYILIGLRQSTFLAWAALLNPNIPNDHDEDADDDYYYDDNDDDADEEDNLFTEEEKVDEEKEERTNDESLSPFPMFRFYSMNSKYTNTTENKLRGIIPPVLYHPKLRDRIHFEVYDA